MKLRWQAGHRPNEAVAIGSGRLGVAGFGEWTPPATPLSHCTSALDLSPLLICATFKLESTEDRRIGTERETRTERSRILAGRRHRRAPVQFHFLEQVGVLLATMVRITDSSQTSR